MGQRRCQSQTELWGVGGPGFEGVWARYGAGRGGGGGWEGDEMNRGPLP